MSLGASFESLPCEIILHILPRIPDLATLCNFIHASSVAFRAFNKYNPVSTVERVLSSGSGEVPPWNHYDLMGHLFTQPQGSWDVYKLDQLDPDLDLDTIHRLLRTARDITRVAHACLDDCLELFSSTKPRLQTADTGVVDGSKLPPTWTEEQRAVRAIWRLQLAKDSIGAKWELGSWSWGYVKSAIHLPTYECQPPRNTKACCYWNPTEFEFAMHEPTLPSLSQDVLGNPNPEYHEMVSIVEYIGRRFGQENAVKLACSDVSISELLAKELSASDKCISCSDNHFGQHQTVNEYQTPLPTETDEGTLLRPSAAVRSTPNDKRAEMYKCGYAFWSNETLRAHGSPHLHSCVDQLRHAHVVFPYSSLEPGTFHGNKSLRKIMNRIRYLGTRIYHHRNSL